MNPNGIERVSIHANVHLLMEKNSLLAENGRIITILYVPIRLLEENLQFHA